MPEVVHALRPPEKPRAIHHVGPAIHNRLEQPCIISRVVLQIRVLYQDNLARSFGEPAPQRRALALVLRLKEKAQAAQRDGIAAVLARSRSFAALLPLLQPLEDLPSPVGRAIVHENHFLAQFRVHHAPKNLLNRCPLVVHRHDDGHLRVAERPWIAPSAPAHV